ncbi:hypothetical protein SAMN04487950_2177 [Halogranum rubrum]|uniref:Uncharacterized protein n=1 Tax=Halogranum rubrum TaxID=553466 RepID=A0A1I4EH09_9EURY|nr:hypothetical protein [Halogranum rubrum]SFL05045.1 hypothetical protein SAMN04487950_2177 [Halogranum rubrum]
MPWRDEIHIDAVDYSDKPIDDGPAPRGDEIQYGNVAELLTQSDGHEVTVELQYWWPQRADIDVEKPVSSAAAYIAWRVDDQTGHYGVFDGHAKRVWFGMNTVEYEGRTYSFVDIGPDWRDKLFWTTFADGLYTHHLQYPAHQTEEITVSDVNSIVDHNTGPKSSVCEVLTNVHSQTLRYQFQAWRPKTSQAVFFAVRNTDQPVWHATRGVLDRQSLLSDSGTAIKFDEESFRDVYQLAANLRDDDLTGFQYCGE